MRGINIKNSKRREEEMKLIEGFEERDRCGRSVFSHNGLSYELIPEYGNFPDEFEFSMYSGGCCDRHTS